MIQEFLEWLHFRTLFEPACLATGIAVVVPFAISRRARKWIARLDGEDIQAVGLVVLVLAVVGIGLYNRFGAGFGA